MALNREGPVGSADLGAWSSGLLGENSSLPFFITRARNFSAALTLFAFRGLTINPETMIRAIASRLWYSQ